MLGTSKISIRSLIRVHHMILILQNSFIMICIEELTINLHVYRNLVLMHDTKGFESEVMCTAKPASKTTRTPVFNDQKSF